MPKLSIKKIEMKNFMQFMNAVVELNPSPGKEIAVIQGSAGSGKSNILKAIDWCLFRSERPNIGLLNKTPVLCNHSSFDSLEENSYAEVSVKMLFDMEGVPLEIFRGIKVYKDHGGSELQVLESMEFKIKERGEPVYDTAEKINELFPQKARCFFLVDLNAHKLILSTADEVEKIRRNGFDPNICLSAGEAILIWYRGLAALGKSLSLPIIIDSPWSRISSGFYEHIADLFKKEIKSSQVIFLIHPSDYPGIIDSELKDMVSDWLAIEEHRFPADSRVVKVPGVSL